MKTPSTTKTLIFGIEIGIYTDWGLLLTDLIKGFTFTTDLVAEQFNLDKEKQTVPEYKEESTSQNVTVQNQ